MKISSFSEIEGAKLNLNIPAREKSQQVKPGTMERKPAEKITNDKLNEKINLSGEKLEGLVKAANEVMEAMDKKLEFSIHEGTNRIMVKIVDRHDGTVIREIPPEKMLDIVAKMWEVVGLFVDEMI
ncbi:MAG: flagellar protein FlaG [Clostridia bacterium]|jgi:flagellar protein FlaG|nr:flagellar protein FlaG [Clostridia bacterium]